MRSAAAATIAIALFAFAGAAWADAFYPAIRVQCDAKAGTLRLINAGAYNEQGIRKSDAKRGLYVPSREAPSTEIRCDSAKTRFLVSMKPVLDRHDKGDTARISVSRNGQKVLDDMLLDDDRAVLQSSSFVKTVSIAATGEAKIEHSCQAQVPLAITCRAGSPAKASPPRK
jgi:hypothetical protein